MANRRAGKHIITTAIEHAAVLQPMLYLQEQGFEITFLPVDETGLISLEELKEALREDTILVSIMYVNNEVGAREPVEEAAELSTQTGTEGLVSIRMPSRLTENIRSVRKSRHRSALVSGHKIMVLGSGFSTSMRKRRFIPDPGRRPAEGHAFRYGQCTRDRRTGSSGSRLLLKDFEEKQKKLRALRNYFIEEVEKLPDIQVNGPKEEEKAAPQIVSVSFRGVRSEVLLHALEERGIYVSLPALPALPTRSCR